MSIVSKASRPLPLPVDLRRAGRRIGATSLRRPEPRTDHAEDHSGRFSLCDMKAFAP